MIPVNGLLDVDVNGFGFAESQWLGCRVGLVETAGVYVDLERIQCAAPPGNVTDTIPVAAINALHPAPQCHLAAMPEPHYLPAGDVTIMESLLQMDGEKQYASSAAVAARVATNYAGFTFGAWFMPQPVTKCDRGPVVCFAPTCDPLLGSRAITAEVCIEYAGGNVRVTSDIVGGSYNLSASEVHVAAVRSRRKVSQGKRKLYILERISDGACKSSMTVSNFTR